MKYVLILMLTTGGPGGEPRGITTAEFDDFNACNTALTAFRQKVDPSRGSAAGGVKAGVQGVCVEKATPARPAPPAPQK